MGSRMKLIGECRFCGQTHKTGAAQAECRERWLADQRTAPWVRGGQEREARAAAMKQSQQDTEFGEAQEQQAEPPSVVHLGEELGYVSNGVASPPDPRKDGTCGMPEWIRLAMKSEPTGTLEHLD